MRRLLTLSLLAALLAAALPAEAESPRLFRTPAVSQTRIVFSFAGDLWTAPRAGGEAVRLTVGPGLELGPSFSPDGQWIAFSGEYDGNRDVFIVAATGGVPRRLTWHPSEDEALGWTPDGQKVLFRSNRYHPNRLNRLYTVSAGGGFPVELALPNADEGSLSADGRQLAYVPVQQWQDAWKRYRGGQTRPIWLADLSPSKILDRVPRDNSNDFNAMWIDGQIYFLSDRNGPVTLFAYDPAARKVRQLVENRGFDLKSASAGPGAIVYEQFGGLYLYEPGSGRSQRVSITLRGDLAEVRPHWRKVAGDIRDAAISPTGARAVFAARGEILTVPAEKGDVRNLTRTPGVHERSPGWSPDGRWIAFFSEASGEYALHVVDQKGTGEVKKIALGEPPSFFYDPLWSPDSKKIAYTDKRLNIWYVEVEKAAPVKVDTALIYNRRNQQTPAWSPDSQWIAYSRLLDNRLAAIFVYSLETGKSTQLTDGMSDAAFPVFDGSGKYLCFTASTNVGPTQGEGLATLDRQASANVYLAVLRKDLPSPLAPESDEEKVAEDKPAEPAKGDAAGEPKPAAAEAEAAQPAANAPAAKPAADTAAKPAAPAAEDGKKKGPEPVPVTIDFEGLAQRILALPVPARNYVGLAAGKAGTLFLVEQSAFNPYQPGPSTQTVYRFDLEKRKEEKAFDGLSYFVLSANGEKALVRQGPGWSILPAAAPGKPGEGGLKLERMEVWVDPKAEWRQMYHEVWRGERDFFYSPQFHGLDLARAEKRYLPFLEGVASRWDLNYLFTEMLGELTVGHLFVGGGTTPEVKSVPGGLLGADYAVENGRYRIARVYSGESWNPQLQAPLTQPGVNVAAGEYLLAINGVDLRPPQDLDALLEGTASRPVLLKGGPNADGTGSRDVTVVPVGSEYALRHFAWVEDNRRLVEKASGGRIAYVYLPNTYLGGFTYFNRYFFAQLDKQAVLVDERYNSGGALADYVVDYLRRPLLNYIVGREGRYDVMPYGAIFGPKAMLINEFAGSGGDAMPYYFKKLGIGPLIGKRTWGGLVRASQMPTLLDGGYVTAPDAALWSETGEWVAENKGVAPDLEVEFDPEAVRAGRDPQLEAGVRYLIQELEKNPPRKHEHPPYADYDQEKHWP